MPDRTVTVNGVDLACGDDNFPAAIGGAFYFDISSGENTSAEVYWWGFELAP
jgi:hypothetical protein